MAKQRPAPPGKRRTREHIIADLSINHVERQILLCGFAALRVQPDYGYDLIVSTFDESGEIEPGAIYVQVKATDDLPTLKNGNTISWPVSRRDLKLWLKESYPVVLVVYDGKRNRAYWLDVGDFFAERPQDLFGGGEWINVHLSTNRRLNRKSVQRIAQNKRRIHQNFRTRDRTHE